MALLAATRDRKPARTLRPEGVLGHVHRPADAVDHDVGHGRFEGGAQVGYVLTGQRQRRFGPLPHGRLETGEREMRLRAPDHGARQGKTLTLAATRRVLDLRPARIAETEQLRRFVESFADGVVDGGAEPAVAADAFHE